MHCRHQVQLKVAVEVDGIFFDAKGKSIDFGHKKYFSVHHSMMSPLGEFSYLWN